MTFIMSECWKKSEISKKRKMPLKTLLYRNFLTFGPMMICLIFLHNMMYIAVLYVKILTKKLFDSQKWDLDYHPLWHFPFCFSKKWLFSSTVSSFAEKRLMMTKWNCDILKLQSITFRMVYNTYVLMKNWRLNNFFTKKCVLSPGKVVVSWTLSYINSLTLQLTYSPTHLLSNSRTPNSLTRYSPTFQLTYVRFSCVLVTGMTF